MTSLFRSLPLGDCFYSSLSVQLLAEKKFFFHQGFTLSKAEEPLQDMDLQKKEEKYEKQTKVLFKKPEDEKCALILI